MAILQDPPSIVRGEGVDNLEVVANGAVLTIRPAVGVEWIIETLIYGGACTIALTDGSNPVTYTTEAAAGVTEKCELHITRDLYITITNTSGGGQPFGYVGYILNV